LPDARVALLTAWTAHCSHADRIARAGPGGCARIPRERLQSGLGACELRAAVPMPLPSASSTDGPKPPAGGWNGGGAICDPGGGFTARFTATRLREGLMATVMPNTDFGRKS